MFSYTFVSADSKGLKRAAPGQNIFGLEVPPWAPFCRRDPLVTMLPQDSYPSSDSRLARTTWANYLKSAMNCQEKILARKYRSNGEERRPPGTISRFCGWCRVWLFRGDSVELPGALFVEDGAFGFVSAAPVFVAAGDEEVFAWADALFAGVILI